MINILIYIITALFLLLFVVPLDYCKIDVNVIFKRIMDSVFQFRSVLVKCSYVSVVFIVGVLSYVKSMEYLNGTQEWKTACFALCIFIMLLFGIYIVLGSSLIVFTKIEKLMPTVSNRKLSYHFLTSAYILLMYFVMFLLKPELLFQNNILVLIGLVLAYFLNMRMLVNISMEPLSCYQCSVRTKEIENPAYPLKVVLAGAIILIILIVLNLFLGVTLIDGSLDGAYINLNQNKLVTVLDLFYYTVISFTTIGYGEIVPQCLESKLMAVIIAYTSVMCLIIFISAILSLKDKYLKG